MSDRHVLVSEYVELGWVPFAYISDTTPPFNWQSSVITDTTITECAAVTYPIGVVLGKPSQLVVIDIDPQNGGDVQRLIDRYGSEKLETYVVSTPSGGLHLYYAYPDVDYLPKRINAGRWVDGLTGVDFLADGHHVQVPPTTRIGHSTKPDGKYTVVGDRPVAALPAALLADWLDSLVVTSEAKGDPVDLIPDVDHSWALQLHETKLHEAVHSPIGQRDETVHRCLCVSVRVAMYLPDDVLTIDEVETAYETAYESEQGEEIVDLPGKVRRATELARSSPWLVENNRTPLPEGVPETSRFDYERRVEQVLVNDAAKAEARRRQAESAAETVELPPIMSGSALALYAKDRPEWAIEGLLAPGQSVLFSAQRKSGKTTASLNLIHSLTTGEPFLGQYRPARKMTVAYFDLELGAALAHSYMDQIGIDRERVHYIDLQGRGKSLDTRTDAVRNAWARRLRELDVDAIIIDPVSPVLSSAGLDENATTGVRQLLDSFDALSRSAGCTLGPVVVHHAGWSESGRARGSSAFGDWPGAEWNLRKSDADDPFSVREFAIQSNRANGGSIHTGRTLSFDPVTRRTWYAGATPMSDSRRDAYDAFIGTTVSPVTVASVKSAVGGSDHTIKSWLDSDPRTVVINDGGRGQGARTWLVDPAVA